MAFALGYKGICAGFTLAGGGNPTESVLGGAGEVARLVSGYRRFNKIAKGEWMIVDMPEPRKSTERVPGFIPVHI